VVSPLVGYRWLLTRLSHSGQAVSVPDAYQASCQFAANGQFLASDSVNTISGNYAETASGFTLRNTATTLIGYAGSDPVRLQVIAAMRALTMANATAKYVLGPAPETVVVTIPDYQFDFIRSGPATAFLSPVQTPTR
jgi:hypothetical protein